MPLPCIRLRITRSLGFHGVRNDVSLLCANDRVRGKTTDVSSTFLEKPGKNLSVIGFTHLSTRCSIAVTHLTIILFLYKKMCKCYLRQYAYFIKFELHHLFDINGDYNFNTLILKLKLKILSFIITFMYTLKDSAR